MTGQTVAQHLAAAFVRRGVARVFGIPGGGSSLDMIRACGEQNLPFVLTRTETAAVIMAAVTAETTGTLGIAFVTQGPGVASAVNGMAYASLDRAPVMLLSDGWSAKQSFDSHQRFDQAAVLAPLIKDRDRLDGDTAAIERLIDAALAPPQGPVYVELTAETASRAIQAGGEAAPPKRQILDRGALEAARALLARAERPVVLVGLEARTARKAVCAFVEALACPVLTTYKGKGAIPADHPNLVGLFTGASAERACVQEADVIVMLGLDPVELLGRPWAYTAPVIEIAAAPSARVFVAPEISIQGPLGETLEALRGGNRSSIWTAEQIRSHRDAMRARLAYRGNGQGLSPDAVILDAVAAGQAARARATVDAGAHMVSATTLWPARAPGDFAISNGLSTMGFALPAAIALALADRTCPVIAFTGDAGVMMCLSELSTAVQERARICVVVFNDALLSLIELKQRARAMPRAGVDLPPTDFATIARGFGLTAWNAHTRAEYRAALAAALAHDGPTLIDVAVDPTGYSDQLAALRN